MTPNNQPQAAMSKIWMLWLALFYKQAVSTLAQPTRWM
jgi:hypothetical protein